MRGKPTKQKIGRLLAQPADRNKLLAGEKLKSAITRMESVMHETERILARPDAPKPHAQPLYSIDGGQTTFRPYHNDIRRWMQQHPGVAVTFADGRPVPGSPAPAPSPATEAPLRPLSQTEYRGLRAQAEGKVKTVGGKAAVRQFIDPHDLTR
jgi:hypothetical protein